MSLIPRNNPFDIDHFFNDFWAPSASQAHTGNVFSPRIDIKEADGHYEITAELPGVDKKDIHVYVHDGVMTLEAESNQENKEEKDGKIIRQERRYGKFMRSFNLGGDIQDSDIKASFKDGVLTLEAPKVSAATPEPKRIDIK